MSANRRMGVRQWVTWAALTLILLLLLPSTRYFVPFWQLPAEQMKAFVCMVLGFLASALVASYLARRSAPDYSRSPVQLTLWTMTFFGLVFMFLTLIDLTGWRRIFGEMLVLALILLPATFVYRVRSAVVFAGLGFAIVVALAVSLYLAFGPQPSLPVRTQTTIINTEFYNIEAKFFDGRVPRPAVPGGGGLAMLGDDQYLLVTGDGHFYKFSWAANDDLSVVPLPYRVPLNGEEFAAAVGLPYEKPRETIATANAPLGESVGTQVDTWRFRVSDILLQDLPGGRVRLFAGHHYWDKADRCFTVRVSVTETDRAGLVDGTAKLEWKTLYESKPCLPIEGELRERASPFEGNLSGGRLALRDSNSLLFTVGFHGFDGVNATQLYSQDPDASWGTTVLTHLDTGKSEIFANGQRNQQGLYVDPNGGIWETEHGPRGGDELNFVEQGVNYGWPLVTYGTDYSSLSWPLNKSQGRHDGFREPMYAWVPSIGVSQLIGIQKDLFPIWKHDLLVSSLRAESLFRTRIVDQRVVSIEPIEIKRRVRTLIEGYDGRIVLWTEDAGIGMIRPASGTSAELLFATTCGGCHHVDGGTPLIGPDLLHVYGRRVASMEGFLGYSPALKSLGGRWDKDKLDRFLTNPQAMVPGTAMPFQGIADPAQRAAIIDYLKSLGDN